MEGQARNGSRYMQYIKTVENLGLAYIKNFESVRKDSPTGKWVKDLNSCFPKGNPDAQLAYEKMLSLLSNGERSKPREYFCISSILASFLKSDSIIKVIEQWEL